MFAPSPARRIPREGRKRPPPCGSHTECRSISELWNYVARQGHRASQGRDSSIAIPMLFHGVRNGFGGDFSRPGATSARRCGELRPKGNDMPKFHIFSADPGYPLAIGRKRDRSCGGVACSLSQPDHRRGPCPSQRPAGLRRRGRLKTTRP